MTESNTSRPLIVKGLKIPISYSRLQSEKLQNPPANYGRTSGQAKCVCNELQAKNEELGELKTAPDVARTELAETTVQNARRVTRSKTDHR